jgi:plastocyanin
LYKSEKGVRMKKLAALLAVLALASVGLVACGGDDDDDGDDTAAEVTTEAADTGAADDGAAAGGGGTIDISAPASGEIAYEQSDIEVAAGPATVNFSNPSQVPHDVAIESDSGDEIGKTDVVSEGESTASVELTPGAYTFYCTVPGHRDQGMEGSLNAQ